MVRWRVGVVALAVCAAVVVALANVSIVDASASGDVARVRGIARGDFFSVDARANDDDDVANATVRAGGGSVESDVDDASMGTDDDADDDADDEGEEDGDDEGEPDAEDDGADDGDDEPAFRDDEEVDLAIGTYETCDVCERCALGKVPEGVTVSAPRGGAKTGALFEVTSKRCGMCYECNLVLERLASKEKFRGHEVKTQIGASGAAVFLGRMRADDAGDEVKTVIVKSWCGLRGEYVHNLEDKFARPLSSQCYGDKKLKSRPDFDSKQECRPRATDVSVVCTHAFLGALEKIAVEAGLTDVVPRAQSFRARTFLPWDGTRSAGVKQDVDVIVFEKALGVALESIGTHKLTKENLELLRNINPQKVKQLALYDVLTAQSDRHGQNVFISEGGSIHGIDNEVSMVDELNSMFIPGGQKFEVYRIGYHIVCCKNGGKCGEGTPSDPSMGTMLDYRCYVDNGYIGTNYPPEFKGFLERVDAMKDVREVYEYFKFGNKEHAEKLKARVKDLLTLGFEGAVKKMYAGMKPGDGGYGNFQYPIQPPCCGPGHCKVYTELPDDSKECIHDCNATGFDPRAKYFIGENNESAWRAFSKADFGAAEPHVEEGGATEEKNTTTTATDDIDEVEKSPERPASGSIDIAPQLEALRAKLRAKLSELYDLRRAEANIENATVPTPSRRILRVQS